MSAGNLTAAALMASLVLVAPAVAQTTEISSAPDETIIVTGSRFGGRTATQSATPVDAVSREELQQSGRVDLLQQLKVQVPSFNTPRPLGSGVGDYLLPPSLRGLGPGEVLVLVNGKRHFPPHSSLPGPRRDRPFAPRHAAAVFRHKRCGAPGGDLGQLRLGHRPHRRERHARRA